MNEISETRIPIIVDDVKDFETFHMTRCTYFSIECDEPSPGWTLTLGGANPIPFYLLGLSGIIFKPVGYDLFINPSAIEDLFNLIETRRSLFVDTNEVWFPNHLFLKIPKRGKVYRVSNELFSLAMHFQRQLLSYHDYLAKTRDLEERLLFSEVETKAFSAWESTIIGEAKEKYPKNPELALNWREGNERRRE